MIEDRFTFEKGVADKKEGLPFRAEYETWSYSKQLSYEYGRQFYCVHKSRYRVSDMDMITLDQMVFNMRAANQLYCYRTVA